MSHESTCCLQHEHTQHLKPPPQQHPDRSSATTQEYVQQVHLMTVRDRNSCLKSETVCAVIQSGCQMLGFHPAVEVQHKSGLLLASNTRGKHPQHLLLPTLQMFRQPREAPETSASSSISSTHSIIHSSALCSFRGGSCLCTRGEDTSDKKRKGEVFKFAVKECFEEFIEGSCIFSNDQVRYKYRVSHLKQEM